MLDLKIHKDYSTSDRKTKIFCEGKFESGITTALYGKSGVGKSSVLRMIAGLSTPDKGVISYNSVDWFNLNAKINVPINKRELGFVFQDFNLFPNMTVEGNLKYASNGEIPAEIFELLENTDLKNHLKNYPNQLSGGERQRVSIIRALCPGPKLLLLDEPFSALDDDSIALLIKEIELIQQRLNTTVVMVSHRKDVIFAMAKSVVSMVGEDQVLQGRPEDLLVKQF